MDVRFVIRSPSGKRRNGAAPLPVLVGRGEEAKIRIPQDSVSRRHCEFVERDGRVCIRDLGSTNGTLLDGKRIEPNVDTPVRSGGTVSVGDVAIRIEYVLPRAGYDDQTILLRSLPEAGTAAAASVRPSQIDVGAATDETQTDVGPLPDLEPATGEADDEPTELTAAPALVGGEPVSAAPEPAPSAEDDFAFLSPAKGAGPAAAKAEPLPPAKAPAAPAKPVAKAPAAPAATTSAKQSTTKPAAPAASEQPAAGDAGDFGFLAGASPAPADEDVPAWPTDAEGPAPVDEDDLNDFFKSLS